GVEQHLHFQADGTLHIEEQKPKEKWTVEAGKLYYYQNNAVLTGLHKGDDGSIRYFHPVTGQLLMMGTLNWEFAGKTFTIPTQGPNDLEFYGNKFRLSTDLKNQINEKFTLRGHDSIGLEKCWIQIGGKSTNSDKTIKELDFTVSLNALLSSHEFGPTYGYNFDYTEFYSHSSVLDAWTDQYTYHEFVRPNMFFWYVAPQADFPSAQLTNFQLQYENSQPKIKLINNSEAGTYKITVAGQKTDPESYPVAPNGQLVIDKLPKGAPTDIIYIEKQVGTKVYPIVDGWIVDYVSGLVGIPEVDNVATIHLPTNPNFTDYIQLEEDSYYSINGEFLTNQWFITHPENPSQGVTLASGPNTPPVTDVPGDRKYLDETAKMLVGTHVIQDEIYTFDSYRYIT
uniref:hypothetical protein n=1 Tax=Bacillus thuringiensis TaxID=1428 RepID=UPI003B985E5C